MAKLTAEQKADIINKYKSGDKEWAIAATKEIANQAQTPTPKNTSRDQGSGNYKYNEATWYYEKEWTERASSTYTPAKQETTTTTPTTPTTPTPKAEETVVSTDSEIKQEWRLKPLTQEYYNQTSDEAINKIKDNLNTYKQTNPEYFRSYEDFKKNFSYDARNEEQKNALDTWYRGYEDGLWLAATPTADLYTQYQDGNLSANQLESLRISNPTKYTELQNQINKWNIIAAYDDDKSGTTTGTSIQDMAYQMMVQTFNQFMNGDNTSGASQFFRDYEDKMNDPEMLWLSDKCTEVQEEMENIQSDLDSIKKSVEAEYEGTWASRAKINAIISDRSYELQLQLRTLNSEYNKYATQYNNRMNQYQNEFSLQLQEYQIQQQSRQQQMQELWFAMDLMNFETNEQKAQREWDYWVKQQEYTNWNINSKDYDTRYKAALKSVQNLLSQYEGIPMQRSAEQMAQDVLKAIENWSDLGTELTKINKQIQNKPEYKKLYNDTYGKSNDISYQTFKLWDKEYIVYNNELMSSEDFNKKYWGKAEWSTWEAKPYDIVDSKVFDTNTMMSPWYNTLGSFLADPKNADKKNWGWCGAFVNRYLKSIWVTTDNYYDDNLDTKLNSVNSSAPTVWSIAVFDYGHITEETGQNHGHVAIVTAVHEDGTFDVIESNFKWDKIIWERKNINPKSTTCKWFFDPSQPPAWESMVSESVTSNTPTAVDNLTLTALKNWQIVNSKVPETINQLVEAGFSQEEIENALNQNMTYYLTDDQRSEKNTIINNFTKQDAVKNFQESAWQLLSLSATIQQSNWAADIATVFQFMKALDPNSVVRESEFQTAADSAWLGGKIQTILTKLENWEQLTQEQRDNFFKVASAVLESKKAPYKIAYDETIRQLKAANIPEVYYPTDWTKEIDNIISKMNVKVATNDTKGSTAPTGNWYTPIVSWATWNTNTTVNVGGYDFPSTF